MATAVRRATHYASLDVPGVRLLDPDRVISSFHSTKPPASAVQTLVHPIASHKSWESNSECQHSVFKAASPQKIASSGQGRLRGWSGNRATDMQTTGSGQGRQRGSSRNRATDMQTTSSGLGRLKGLSANDAKATSALGTQQLPGTGKSSPKPSKDVSSPTSKSQGPPTPASAVLRHAATHHTQTHIHQQGRNEALSLKPSKDVSSATSKSQGPPTPASAVIRRAAKHHTPKQMPQQGRNEALSVRLDQDVFRNFWPLLDESRDYARLSGCRFRSRSFDGIAGEKGEAGRSASAAHAHLNDTDSGLTAARARAAPAVYRFAERLRAGDAALLEELEKAFRIVMAESVRSAMIATCQVLELWPPCPAPAGIAAEDCGFEDVSAAIPVIAQRLYNDETRRGQLTPHKGDVDPMRRRAMMASFVVEFAGAAGVPVPELPETYDMMLRDFKMQALEWEREEDNNTSPVAKEHVHQGDQAEVSATNDSNAVQTDSTWSSSFATIAIAAVFGAATADYKSLSSRRPQMFDI